MRVEKRRFFVTTKIVDLKKAPFFMSNPTKMPAFDCPENRLILASRSPRRRQLMSDAGYRFEVCPADESVEDGVNLSLPPDQLVAELARRKAEEVVSRGNPTVRPGDLVLGCDTVAEVDGHILGKPTGRDDARRMLQSLRGRTHRVLSGVCLWKVGQARPMVEVDRTILRMDLIQDRQLEAYLDSGQWEGKAGAFGYQDQIEWIHVLQGSESNVVGLPMELFAGMLDRLARKSS